MLTVTVAMKIRDKYTCDSQRCNGIRETVEPHDVSVQLAAMIDTSSVDWNQISHVPSRSIEASQLFSWRHEYAETGSQVS